MCVCHFAPASLRLLNSGSVAFGDILHSLRAVLLSYFYVHTHTHTVPSPRLTWHSAWYSKHCETSIFGEEKKKLETPENRCKSNVFIETQRKRERERGKVKGKENLERKVNLSGCGSWLMSKNPSITLSSNLDGSRSDLWWTSDALPEVGKVSGRITNV